MSDRISIDPQIHFGKPCITNTRIPVENVRELIDEGFTFEEIVRDFYPDLSINDVQACIDYTDELKD
jgi:uncharacterized protein (DUF433 family)